MTGKKLSFSALFLAMGVLLPMAFHTFGMGGPGFLPMHLPVLLGGLLLGPFAGVLLGISTPFLSSLLTGMPPLFPMLPIMVTELAAYGYFSGLFSVRWHGNVYLALVGAMVVGRVFAGIAAWVMIHFFGFRAPGAVAFVLASVSTGFIGILIQLLLLPPLTLYLRRFVGEGESCPPEERRD